MISHISLQLSMLRAPDRLASEHRALLCRLLQMSPVEFLLWRSSIWRHPHHKLVEGYFHHTLVSWLAVLSIDGETASFPHAAPLCDLGANVWHPTPM